MVTMVTTFALLTTAPQPTRKVSDPTALIRQATPTEVTWFPTSARPSETFGLGFLLEVSLILATRKHSKDRYVEEILDLEDSC